MIDQQDCKTVKNARQEESNLLNVDGPIKMIHALARSLLFMHHVTPKLIDEEISEINDYLIAGLDNCVLES